jgi:hypothetical protein
MRWRSRRPANVRALWKAHLGRDFPPRLRGEEIGGIDMVMLDADVAGCVSTWMASTTDLDQNRLGILRQCVKDAGAVLPALTDPDERRYYEGVAELASALLAEHHRG